MNRYCMLLVVIISLLGRASSQKLRRLRNLKDENNNKPLQESRESNGDGMTEFDRLLELDPEMSFATPLPSTSSSSSPTTASTTTPTTTTLEPTQLPSTPGACDPSCPCCVQEIMPEFVRAIEAFSPNKCQIGEDCCLQSETSNTSELLLLVECDTSAYNVAYMSYDYVGSRVGCTPGQVCKMCGDSAFGEIPWIVLNDTEAEACEQVVRSRIQDPGGCSQSWPCA